MPIEWGKPTARNHTINAERIPIMSSKSGFTAEEKAAMKERAKELKAETRAKKQREVGEQEIGRASCRERV